MRLRRRKEDRHPPPPSPSPAEAMSMFYMIIPSQCHKLKLPYKFGEEHGNDMKTEGELVVPNGATWKVQVEKSDRSIWLSDGWKEFMEHYAICYGDLVMFKYIIGSSRFCVVIFSKNASEIEYPRISLHKQEEEEDSEDDCSSVEILG